MSRRWRKRLTFALLVWAAVFGSMAIAGTDPQPVLVAVVFAVLAAVAWLSIDLSREVEPGYWKVAYRDTELPGGADPRVAVLRRRITESVVDRHQAAQLHAVLLGVVQDKLRAGHGIELTAQPDAASHVLGPDLTSYLVGGSSAGSPRKLPAVEAIVTRIEAL